MIMHHKRLIIDLLVSFPDPFTPLQVAQIMQDYIKLNRFNSMDSQVHVSVYDIKTRVIQQPISLASNLNDIKS